MIRFANLDWKPCPFCGKEDLDIKDEEHFIENDGCMYVECDNCNTDLWMFDTEKYTYDEAIALMNTKWNTRISGDGAEYD